MSHGATAGISKGQHLSRAYVRLLQPPALGRLLIGLFSCSLALVFLVLIGAEIQYAKLLATYNYTSILLNTMCQTLLKQLTSDFSLSSQPYEVDTIVTATSAEW